MLRMLRTPFCVAMFVLLGLIGCQKAEEPKVGERKWEIVAENQSNVPCAVSVDLGGGTFNDARVDELSQGKRWVLLSAIPKVIVRSAKVVRNAQVQEVKPNVEVPIGKRYLILVTADGKLNTSMADQ